jgi:phytoene synthase
MTMPAIEVEHAYRRCEEITRRQAANFYYGIRLLPRDKRHAMSAVYAFARRVDDIGDGNLPADRQIAALAADRAMLATVAEDRADPSDPVAVALANAHLHYRLPLDALELLIDGVELDVLGTRYETFDELVGYCRRVAGSVGRLCLAIFADGGAARLNGASGLADDLGVAMQLTNILRDVREDRERGRVYLPAEDLRRFGCGQDPFSGPEPSEELIRYEAARAGEWFERGLRLVDVLDARSASCVLAMTGIYRGILERIARQPATVLRERISLPVWEKAWVALRSLADGRGDRRAAGAGVLRNGAAP